jgi:hypothetical protein
MAVMASIQMSARVLLNISEFLQIGFYVEQWNFLYTLILESFSECLLISVKLFIKLSMNKIIC